MCNATNSSAGRPGHCDVLEFIPNENHPVGEEPKSAARVSSPLLEQTRRLTDEENEELVLQFFRQGTEELRAEVLTANLHLVRHTVGRYLYHWPETKRWEDDMVSVGVMALLEKIDALEEKRIDHFRAWAVPHIKWRIEDYLNNNRTSVAAALAPTFVACGTVNHWHPK